MQALLLNGSVIDWILGLMAAEAILSRSITARSVELVFTLLAGAWLLLALRGGLAERSAVWTALALAAALLAHLADLGRRAAVRARANDGPDFADERPSSQPSVKLNRESARPRASGDPEPKNWIPASAGMSGSG